MALEGVAARCAERTPPGVVRVIGCAEPGRSLPLRLGGKAPFFASLRAEPRAISGRLVPADADDRLEWVVEIAILPSARFKVPTAVFLGALADNTIGYIYSASAQIENLYKPGHC